MVYLKVHDLLKSGIHAGFYRQGESLPAETDLARQFQVSRNTLRKALKMLRDAGFLECRQGAGNFVSHKNRHVDFLKNLKGFSEIVGDADITAKNRVLKFEIQLASPIIANALAIKFRDNVYYLSRLRYVNGLPVELENSWISADRFGDLTLDSVNGSLYHYFEKTRHIHVSGAYLHFSPLLPPGDVADLLNISRNMPIIKVQSQCVDMLNVPFLFSENYTNFLEYPIKMFVPRHNLGCPIPV